METVGKKSDQYFCCGHCEMGIAWKNDVKRPISLALQEQTKTGVIDHVGCFFIANITSNLWVPEGEREPTRMILIDYRPSQTTKITYIYCSNCFFQLGWKVLSVEEGNLYYPFQKGQFVLPSQNILLWNGYNLQVPRGVTIVIELNKDRPMK